MAQEELRYTKEHEWIRRDGDVFTVGISDYAAEKLGDITYVEAPETGKELAQGEEAGVIESVKAASDLYAPISGTVVEVNPELEDQPELVNESPCDKGWILKMSAADPAQLDALMDADAYAEFIKGLDD